MEILVLRFIPQGAGANAVEHDLIAAGISIANTGVDHAHEGIASLK